MHSKLFLFAVSFCSIFSFGQISPKLTSKIDSLIQLENPRIFNGVILITQKGKPVYSKTYGFADFEEKIPLKLDDQFKIMSNSKLFTSVLVMQQVEKGKIDLHAAIGKYLPELSQSWKDSITVHQLLNHTHGIDELDKPLLFKPGTDFKYGNLSNKLLGKILENVTGKTYCESAEKLFKKLVLNGTNCYSKEKKSNLVKSYRIKGTELFEISEVNVSQESIPADGIFSNAHDLAKWNDALHNGNVLKKESYKLLTTSSAQSQHNVFGKEKMGYGYNIRIATQNGIKYIGHTGIGSGFTSMNLYFPDYDITVIVLENMMNDDRENWYFYETEIKNLVVESLAQN